MASVGLLFTCEWAIIFFLMFCDVDMWTAGIYNVVILEVRVSSFLRGRFSWLLKPSLCSGTFAPYSVKEWIPCHVWPLKHLFLVCASTVFIFLCLISPNVTPSRFSSVVTNGRVSFFLWLKRISTHMVHFLCPSIHGQIQAASPPWLIVSDAVINTAVLIFSRQWFHFL